LAPAPPATAESSAAGTLIGEVRRDDEPDRKKIARQLPSENAKEQLLDQAKRALDEVTKLVQAIEAMG
jgi:hypothetical protein